MRVSPMLLYGHAQLGVWHVEVEPCVYWIVASSGKTFAAAGAAETPSSVMASASVDGPFFSPLMVNGILAASP